MSNQHSELQWTTSEYQSGAACFLCSEDSQVVNIGSAECPRCSPTVTLDLSHGQRVLEHIGAHVLHDPGLNKSTPLCGLCLRPAPLCQFFLKKGKGANGRLRVNETLSRGCLVKVKYAYHVASKSTASSPCSNVPIQCPLCPNADPVVWRYFMKTHFREVHPNAPILKYDHLWKISNFEISEMKKIWAKRLIVTATRTRKTKIPPLIISEDHRAQIPRCYNIIRPILEGNHSHTFTLEMTL